MPVGHGREKKCYIAKGKSCNDVYNEKACHLIKKKEQIRLRNGALLPRPRRSHSHNQPSKHLHSGRAEHRSVRRERGMRGPRVNRLRIRRSADVVDHDFAVQRLLVIQPAFHCLRWARSR